MEKSYTYTGKPIKPPFALNINGKTLVQGEDYRMEILDNINVGTAHVYITGLGDYTGSYVYTFEIEPVQARTLSYFADSTVFLYDGKPKTMQIAVKFGDISLEEEKDYDIQYENNILPGKASLTLTFKGNFTGTMSIPFTIKSDLPELVNNSTVPVKELQHGKSIILESSAEGGSGDYLYSALYKKTTDPKWKTAQNFGEEKNIRIKPAKVAEYQICSKIKDNITGDIVKKFFKLTVTN